MSKRKLESKDFDDLWKKIKEFENEIARAKPQHSRHRQHRGDSRLEVPPLLPSRSRPQSPEPESPGSSRSSSVESSSSSCSRSSCSQRGRGTPPTRSRSAGLPPLHTPSQEPLRYEDVPLKEGEHNRERSVTGNARPPPAPPGSEPQQLLVAELDDELLQVLGEDPSKDNTPATEMYIKGLPWLPEYYRNVPPEKMCASVISPHHVGFAVR